MNVVTSIVGTAVGVPLTLWLNHLWQRYIHWRLQRRLGTLRDHDNQIALVVSVVNDISQA